MISMTFSKFFQIRDQMECFRVDLLSLMEQEQENYRNRLRDEINTINNSLEEFKVPELFRIAIVGTFKTGKSSFVNKLAEEKIAGVETNPETAAISIFRYADQPRAEVKLISLEEWQRMELLYEESPKNPEAYRIAGLHGFNEYMSAHKNQEDNSNKFDPIDVNSLIDKWLKPEGHTHVIEIDNWDTKKGKQDFRKAIKDFTSSRNPLHFFVKELIIYAPVPFLKDHVELIDTPGLNDTQLYRGQLTEDLLAEVDGILFLTRSGASFSEYDKKFIVRQLRKKRLHHLRLIVTQVDNTYDNAYRDAMDEDEIPPTFQEVKSKEEIRLRAEISKTLNELLEDTNLKEEDGYYYMEQLDSLKIHFISSRWFEEGNIENSGIPQIREALFEILSENFHINHLINQLEHTFAAVRGRLRDFFYERYSVMETEFDPAKVKENMAKLESNLGKIMDKFQSTMTDLKISHDCDQESLSELLESHITSMKLLASSVIDEYEKSDISKHWKTRRHGYWGYLNEIGTRVADRIFPIMNTSLTKQLTKFNHFMELASLSLDGLESQISCLESDSEIEGLPKIEFNTTKQRFMNEFTRDLNEHVTSMKDRIVSLLEEFASGELKETLSNAKNNVADVWGSGTTIRQSGIVSEFYDSVDRSLKDTLEMFLKDRLKSFRGVLSNYAENLFPKLRVAIESLLSTREQVIEEHLRIQNSETKIRLEAYLQSGLSLFEGKESNENSIKKTDNLQLKENVLNINEDATGFSYESLFGNYLISANKIEIKEPYLLYKYQLDNFQQFCELLSKYGNARQIQLTTRPADEYNDLSDNRLQEIQIKLKQYGIEMIWTYDPSLHAREIKTNDGWVILSDRGLDIYKKPESRNDFGQFDSSLRRCKQTQIHIHKI